MIYAALQSDTLSWQRSLKFAGFIGVGLTA